MSLNCLYRDLREKSGVSVGVLSHRTNISRRTIERFEAGITNMGHVKLSSMCKAIGYQLIIKKIREDEE